MTAPTGVAGVPDSTVRFVTSLPDHLPGGRQAGLCAEAIPGTLLLEIPGVARYLVSGGRSVDIAIEPDTDQSEVETFLNGAARAALVHQRGELPLQAAAIMLPSGQAIALCGASGMGKSTLAAEFCRRGGCLLADDMSRITWDSQAATVWPESPFVKLWQDTLNRMGLDAAKFQRVRHGMEKFLVPVVPCRELAPIGAIVSLTLENCEIGEIHGAARLGMLSANTLYPHQIEPLGQMRGHMRIVHRVATAVKVLKLGNARAAAAGELADRVLDVLP